MMPDEFDVTGKVIFMRGAWRGIGECITHVLAESGAEGGSREDYQYSRTK
jgi:hypothetical protein